MTDLEFYQQHRFTNGHINLLQFVSYLHNTISTNHNSNREVLQDIWYNLPLTSQGSL